MSISGIGSGATGGGSDDALAQIRQSWGVDQEIESFAQSMVKRRDADGDGLLNIGETGLKDDAFGAMDADGDGFLSADELSAQMKEKVDQMSSMMGQLSVIMQSVGEGKSSEDIAASLIKGKDADGDGALSLDESGLGEKLFGQLDADGDGSLTSEETADGIEKLLSRFDPENHQPAGLESEVEAASSDDSSTTSAVSADSSASVTESSDDSSASGVSGASGGGGGGGESEDEDYDEYDLNKDGVVSMEEYLQAYLNGDTSLSDMFGGEEQGQGQGQSLIQRLGMQAYNAQASFA